MLVVTAAPTETTSAPLAFTVTSTSQESQMIATSTPTTSSALAGAGTSTTVSSIPNSQIHACGHSATSCVSHEPVFFSPECLYGGLGCNALGLTCCRFCGFGVFAEIPCPSIPTPTPLTTTSTSPSGQSSKCVRIARALATRFDAAPCH